MRLATSLLLGLLGLAALVLAVAEPVSATAQGPPPIEDGDCDWCSGMTCCHYG